LGGDNLDNHSGLGDPGPGIREGVMAARESTLTNVDRAEYGTITVDLDLLDQQIAWLAGLPVCGEREGILNLLGGIMDLTDPPDEEDQCTDCGDQFRGDR
jgi:hypothetical protein